MRKEAEQGQIGYHEFNKEKKKWELHIEEGIRQPEFATMSKRPAIGHGYIKRNYHWHIDNLNSYVIQNGYKKAIPRYYKDKIFQDLDKEALTNKTEKQMEEMYEKQKHLSELFKKQKTTPLLCQTTTKFMGIFSFQRTN